jgi:hypothetical protein
MLVYRAKFKIQINIWESDLWETSSRIDASLQSQILNSDCVYKETLAQSHLHVRSNPSYFQYTYIITAQLCWL